MPMCQDRCYASKAIRMSRARARPAKSMTSVPYTALELAQDRKQIALGSRSARCMRRMGRYERMALRQCKPYSRTSHKRGRKRVADAGRGKPGFAHFASHPFASSPIASLAQSILQFRYAQQRPRAEVVCSSPGLSIAGAPRLKRSASHQPSSHQPSAIHQPCIFPRLSRPKSLIMCRRPVRCSTHRA